MTTSAALPANHRQQITVVIPTYNERDNLPRIVGRILALEPVSANVLIATLTGDRVRVLHRASKDGLRRAYVAGMLRAPAGGADIVVQMDADLSHPVEAIPEMIRAQTNTDAVVVVGSRYVAGGSVDSAWPLRRRLLSRWANSYVPWRLRRSRWLPTAEPTTGSGDAL